MSENLVIVESPAKSKTIEKYLGNNFRVISTVGHLRNLPSKEGIDVDNNYKMNYELIDRDHNKPQQIISEIKKALKNAKKLFLATDQDREGEVIAWHLIDILEKEQVLNGVKIERIVFNEITKKAIIDSIQNPRELSYDLINAQFARRSIDYLFGMRISPLLWGIGIRKGSAGRVQSPALKMIIEREEEIRKFDPQEYWTLNANFSKDSKFFDAFLHTNNSKKISKFDINNENEALKIKAELLDNNNDFKVLKVIKKQRKRQPAKPFITSTLQQEASRKLGFAARRTMSVAQDLYTGIDLGEGPVGLITYMRTDSINLAQEAIDEIRDIIPKLFDKDALPDKKRLYTNTSKNAQEAHEAIRPTSFARIPNDLKRFLNKDQFELYSLIWKRTVASQMKDAILDSVSIDIGSKEKFFRSSGQSINYPGFMQVYLESTDDEDANDDDSKILPAMKEGDVVKLNNLDAIQHFTKPPGRYTEASLIKNLEKEGIGRPSTYAAIIETLRFKEYVEIENRTLIPTGKGASACAFLDKNFNDFIKYNYTAELEETLDKISRGESEWIPTTDSFYKHLMKMVGDTEKLSPEERKQERVLGVDPKSGRTVSVRHGPFGPHAMIGTKDDPKEAGKPKSASLKKGQDINTITLEQALELFVLPRLLGETPDGEHITACMGRFGAYLNYGEKKNLSLKGLEKEGDDPFDPYTITFEQALPLVEQKKIIEANKIIQNFEESEIQVLNGRFGPYVTDGNKNVKIPKEQDPKDLSLEECEEMLKNAPQRRGRFGARKKAVTKKKVAKKNKVNKTTKAKKKAQDSNIENTI